MDSFTVGKFKNHATGQKGYAPLFNGKPMLTKIFKRRAEAEKFISDLRASLLAKRDEEQTHQTPEVVVAADVEAAFANA